MGSAQVSQLYADVSFVLEVWVPWGVKPGSQDFLSNLTFLVLVSTVIATSSSCNYTFSSLHHNVFKFCSWKEYTLGHVTRTRGSFTFYLQLTHIFASDTWLLHTWAHVSIMFSFNHPCCCTTMLSCLLLHHHNATTESVWRDKRLQRDQSPICIR